MLPAENAGDDGGGTRKPTRPFLKKGEGTARFGTANYGRKPNGVSRESKIPSAASPAISLPRFTPSSCLPTSSRTVDSGISNEDETRPPTTASLPMDQPSTSPPQNSEYIRNRTPIVVEENEDSRNYVEDEEEPVEGVSAMRTFVPDEGASSLIAPSSQMSEEALYFQAKANQIKEDANRKNSMRSVSITPSSYSSSLSAPMYASTPIVDLTQAHNSFHPPPLLPPNSHSYPFLSSLETPQARLLASNRINLMNQNVAQTGISLLNGQRSRPTTQPLSQHQKISSSRENQKENVQDEHISKVSEHIYDQPFQVPGFRSQDCLNCLQNQKIDRDNYNLRIQLRNTIVHLDYATEGVRSKEKELDAEIEKLKNRQKELEEEYQKKEEILQEDKQAEEERLKRERRVIERDKKMLQKATEEGDKELRKTNATLREKLVAEATQKSKLRQDIRVRDDELKKKHEEIEKLKKENTRCKSTNQLLEKHIKQLRTGKEREDKEKEMFAKAAMNRKTPYNAALLNHSLGTGTSTVPTTSSRHPPISSLANNKNMTVGNKGRSVSFADELDEQSLEAMEETIHPKLIMKACGTASSPFGSCIVYRDSLGEATKVKETVANGVLFQYSNGDLRWMNRQNSVNIYRCSDDKTVVITLVPSNISIRYSFQRQLEVFRPGNNITLISQKLLEVRTELHCPNDGICYTEIFHREGRYDTKSFCHQEVTKGVILGNRYSYRDDRARYVEYKTLEDFELVEPEFRLRWYQGEVMACKIFKRPRSNEKTLRLHLDLMTGNGILEEMESELKDGQSQKKTVFSWPAAT